MGSLSFGEILTIAVVVLVIFGPRRLPDLARRAGALVAKARATLASVTEAMQSEYAEAAEPFTDLKEEISGTGRELREAVTSLGDALESGTDGEDDSGNDGAAADDENSDATEAESAAAEPPAARSDEEDTDSDEAEGDDGGAGR